jgi:hypothetical protein
MQRRLAVTWIPSRTINVLYQTCLFLGMEERLNLVILTIYDTACVLSELRYCPNPPTVMLANLESLFITQLHQCASQSRYIFLTLKPFSPRVCSYADLFYSAQINTKSNPVRAKTFPTNSGVVLERSTAPMTPLTRAVSVSAVLMYRIPRRAP